MQYQITPAFTDTPIDGVPSLSLDRAVLNFTEDWVIKTQTPNEVILVNTTSPLDRQETIRIARNEVANVYGTTYGKNISPAMRAASTQGIELLVQVNTTLAATVNNDADTLMYLPQSCHMVVKVPTTAFDINDVLILIGRTLSSLFNQGDKSVAVAGLEAKFRGSLPPKGM